MKAKCFFIVVAMAFALAMLTSSSFAASWSADVLLNDASETYTKDAHLYPAQGGGFHAMYKDATNGGNWPIRYKRYTTSLGTRYTINPTGWPGGRSTICQAGNGDIWLTWENWSSLAEKEQIYAARSSNGGVSWTSYRITNYPYGTDQDGWAKTPNIAPYGSSTSSTVILASWDAYGKGLKYNTWNGSAWSSVIDMGVSVDNQYAVQGICRSPYDGSVYRTYGRKINNVWQICYKRWDGSSWGPEVVVSTNTGSEFVARPCIAVNSLNQILVVWDQVGSIWYRFYDPSFGWSPQGMIDGNAAYPALTAIPGTTAFYVVYVPANGDIVTVLGRRFIYGQWDPPDLIKNAGGYVINPDVVADSSGRVYAVWETWASGWAQQKFAVCNDYTVQDSTPPSFSGPVIDDGSVTDVATYLHATWSAASDPESGIHHYEYSIGTSPGATNVWGWTNCGNVLEIYHTQALGNGTYYINVKAFNNAGLGSGVVSSDGITISCTANPVTFPAPVSVESSSRACSNVMLARANDGGLHLVYDITDPYVHYRKKNISGTWDTAIGIAPGKFPDIAETTDNVIRCVFTQTDGRENLTLQESSNSSGTWSAATTIFTNMNWYPRLIRGTGGKVHLIDNSTTSHIVKFATRNGSWSSLTDLGTSYRYGTPDMAMGTDGVIHACWIEGTTLKYRKYNGAWSATTDVATGSGYLMPRIDVDANNNPVIVWLGAAEASGYRVLFTAWTGSSWTTPKVIGIGHYPAIAVDQNNKKHIVFSFKGNSGQNDIMHLVYNGSGWTTANNISNNAGVSERPAIEVTNDNGVHVAWQDNSNRANSQIFYTCVGSVPTKGIISGIVKDNFNNPVAGASITTSTGGYSTTSASNGSYTITNVTPGTYSITASKYGYNSQTQTGQVVTAGNTTTCNFTITLVPGTITGTVKDTANNPISGATVSTNKGGYTATTNSTGAYTISNVVADTYDVTASKSGYLSQTKTGQVVTPGNTTTVSFNLTSNMGSISGYVKDECGDPLLGATVSTTSGGYSTTSAADGSYTLNNVIAGSYTVVASKSGYQSQSKTASVTGGQNTSLSFNLSMLVAAEKLQNGSFEGGSFSFWGGTMANGWGAVWRGTFQSCTWTVQNIGGSAGNIMKLSNLGVNSFEAGIIQQVSGLTPGASYKFSAYAYQFDTGCNVWIATDPNGGTTLPARTINFPNITGQWNYQEVNGTVGASGTVSVFLWAWRQWATADVYLNNASLIVYEGGSKGKIQGVVLDQSNNPVSGAIVQTSTGGYSATTASNGTYVINEVTPGTYTVTASKSGYNSQTKTASVAACSTTQLDFQISVPSERVVNGNMEGGFFATGWGSDCSGVASMLPNSWGWNNEAGYPFNTFDETGVRRSGSHSLGFAFCQTASAPGKMGIAWQNVNLGGPNVSKTFTVYAYHTDGNCPSIMAWNPGIGQNNPMTAYYNGRYQWVTTDNWGQRYMWVGRSMTVTSDSSGYVTIMVGGAAHPGTAYGARLYIDDVSVQ